MSDAIIGLDVGTTVAKAVLFDHLGAELHVAEREYGLHTPHPGWAELDPDNIWQAVLGVLRGVAGRVPPGTRIRAMALAAQGGTLIPSRADGTPTYPAITWLDGRTAGLAARWRAEGVGDSVRRTSGWSPEPGLPLLSIDWLRRSRPDLFAASERFLSVNDFLALRLTGCAGTNPSMAGEMLLTDIRTGQVSEELCRLVGIEPDRLSPILPSTAPLGELRRDVCRMTGLAPGTVVVNGGQDHSCEALALGLASAGGALLACGTAWVINVVTEAPAIDALPASMALNYHVVPGRWVASQYLGGLGACLEWWLRQSACAASPTRSGQWAAFDAALAETVPGCGGLIYLPQTGVRQVQGGAQQGGFVGLRLDHSWADMGRAVLEGAAYELRWALNSLREAGLSIETMWMIGGATQSPVWPQIVADVTGVPLLLSRYSHGPALGAAILAAAAMGLFDSVETAQACFRATPRRLSPQGTRAAVHDRQFAAYRRIAYLLAP